MKHKEVKMAKNTLLKSPFAHLIQVGVVVRDMDKAVKRLESLGIGPFRPMNLPPLKGKALFHGKPTDAKVKGLQAKMENIEIELIQPLEGKSPHKQFLDSKGEGIHHIAFLVDDLDKEEANFTKQGVNVLHSGKWQGGGFVYLDFGVGGIVVELMQV
jgi:methylmalonyl-CoA/ethylmalonyl-CoA epimerase